MKRSRQRSPSFALLAWSLASFVVSGCGSCAGDSPACASCMDASAGDTGVDAADAACECFDGSVPPPPTHACDDGNPCTDDVVDGEGCRFDPLADGTVCEDLDFCTLGDRCRAGTCVAGERSESPLSILGRLDAFAGARASFGADRFVMVSRESVLRGRVLLVERTATGLATLSSWEGYLYLTVLDPGEILVGAVPATGIVAVGGRSNRTVQIFDVSETEVRARGAIDSLSGQVRYLAARGDRLWLCTNDFLTGYRITLVDMSDPDAPAEVGSLPLGASACGSIAISEDGDRVYANTEEGVRYLDASPLDTGGDPVLFDVFAPTSSVAVSGSHLILGTPTTVRILNESDRTELVSIPITGARASTLVGDRLLVEGDRIANGNVEVFVSWYDALGPTAPTRLDDVVIARYAGTTPIQTTFVSATDGASLIARTRMFDLESDRLDEVEVPGLRSLRNLARTPGGLRAYDRSGAAAIDLGDGTSPRFVGSASFGAPTLVIDVAIDESLTLPRFVSGVGLASSDDATRVVLDGTNPYYPSPFAIRRWRFDDDATRIGSSNLLLAHQGKTNLIAAGHFVYAFRLPSASTLAARLQGYWLPAVRSGETATPTFDLPLTASSPNARGFDVDPAARVAVVSTETSVAGGPLEPALVFYDLSTSPPTATTTLPTPTLYAELRIVGDRIAALGTAGVDFLTRDAGLISTTSDADRTRRQLLAFDGNVAYVAQLHVVPGASAHEIAASTFGTSGTPVYVEVNAGAKSVIPIDQGLAVGFETQLLTIHPHCPPP